MEMRSVHLETQGLQRRADENDDVLSRARRNDQKAAHADALFQRVEPGTAVGVEPSGFLHEKNVGAQFVDEIRLCVFFAGSGGTL